MRILSLLVLASLMLSCKTEQKETVNKTSEKTIVKDSLIYPEEIHFRTK